MIVKDLINKLQKCNPEARVYTEQYSENCINKVCIAQKCGHDGADIVYLADDLCAIECDLVNIKEVK